MPIEIRELVIRAIVDPSGKADAGGCGSTSPEDPTKPASGWYEEAGDGVVQNCVREVLRILADKRER